MQSWSFQTDNVNDWAYWDKLFTEDECAEIVKICKKKKLSKSRIDSDKKLDVEYRKSNIVFVGPDDIEWVFRRITDACMSLNDRFFNFDIWGLAEGLQFTEYTAIGDKYDAHVDKMFNGRVRKLTFTLQLTKPEKYKGCNLELITNEKDNVKICRDIGYLAMFPSYICHRVTPLEKGTRHSLVGWITGKPFK